MNQIARCDWLHERVRWSHLARSGLPAVSRKKNFPRKPYNKSFIDQVCSVKMAGYWPRSFFASLWTETKSSSINTQKKELGQYPAILTSHLVNNPYILSSLIKTYLRSFNGEEKGESVHKTVIWDTNYDREMNWLWEHFKSPSFSMLWFFHKVCTLHTLYSTYIFKSNRWNLKQLFHRLLLKMYVEYIRNVKS